MSNRDLANTVNAKSAMRSAISSNTTTLSTAIDTFGYDKTMFVCQATAYTDGTYTLSLVECDTSGGSYTAVATANYNLTAASTITALPTLGSGNLIKIGCFGTKQFLKVSVVSTSVTTGATINVMALQEAQNQKTL